jgi:hypothetical protein
LASACFADLNFDKKWQINQAEKSDTPIVPKKPPNNRDDPAEEVEEWGRSQRKRQQERGN